SGQGGDPGGEGWLAVVFCHVFEAGPFPAHGAESFTPAFDEDQAQRAGGDTQQVGGFGGVVGLGPGRFGEGVGGRVTPGVEAGGDDGGVEPDGADPCGECVAEFVVGVGGMSAVCLVQAVEPPRVGGDADGCVVWSGGDRVADFGGGEG